MSGGLDAPFALDDRKHFNSLARALECCARPERQFFHSEVPAGHDESSRPKKFAHGDPGQMAKRKIEPRNLESFVEMQRSWFAVQSQPPEVVEALKKAGRWREG